MLRAATLSLMVLVCVADTALASQPVIMGPRPTGPADYTFAPRVAASLETAKSWVPKCGVNSRMKAAADSVLVRLLGSAMFDQLLVFDPIETDDVALRVASRGLDERSLFYWLVVPNDPDVAARVRVGVMPDGSIVDTFGVPDCAAEESKCIFIDRGAAFRSAAAAGLEAGVIPWRWSFQWDHDGAYYYEIRTIIEREGHWDIGELIRINANDGIVFWRMPTKSYYFEVWTGDDTPN